MSDDGVSRELEGGGNGNGALLRRVSRSVFWNTVLLPVITILNFVLAMMIRRVFGLRAGIYDGLMGILHTVVLYSSLGIPTGLTKFLPDQEIARGRRGVTSVLWKASGVRMLILAVAIVPLVAAPEAVARTFPLGPDGATYLRWLALLIALRALFELVVKALHAFLEQFWVNVLSLIQAILEPALLAAALAAGFGIGGILGALIVTGLVLCLLGGGVVARSLRRLSPEPAGGDASAAVTAGSATKFALFTYVYELSLYFGGVNFARTALLAVVGDEGPLALFSAGFKIAFMVVTLVVSGFRGIYRPLFARLCALQDRQRLQEAFDAVSKVQVFLLLPAGLGLGIMAGDYIPLFFGRAYLPAVPLTWILVAALFVETAFNLGIIILSVDERYRPVLACQAVLIGGAPVFVVVAALWGLLPAAAVLGFSRVVAVVLGYRVARRRYGVRFPWEFSARSAAVALLMGAVLAGLRTVWTTSIPEAVVLTVTGVAIFAVGTRWSGVLGAEERSLLRRSGIPGGRLMIWALGAGPAEGPER